MQECKGIAVPRLEALAVKNYQIHQRLEMRGLTPYVVIVGENGSGKSTLLDILAFFAECMAYGVKVAVNRRGGFEALRSKGQSGPVEIAIKYRERPEAPAIIYHLTIDQGPAGPYVAEEWVQWKRGLKGNICRFLEAKNGKCAVIGGISPHEQDVSVNEVLESNQYLAVGIMGQFSQYPRISALRKYILSWQVELSGQERVSGGIPATWPENGEAARALARLFPERFQHAVSFLNEHTLSGRQIGFGPLQEMILAGDKLPGGMNRVLERLLLLAQPEFHNLMAFENLEADLYPTLLKAFQQEHRQASRSGQVFSVTNSPLLLDACRSDEVWLLTSDAQGVSEACRVDEMPGIQRAVEQGALLGQLWSEGYFIGKKG
ncbi:AAA family ATPase [Azotosporobacter soli]|uniref:AAA family ATPase n=1 Tax=Azotosporobacter soli TaxID=3055040 RepID=UPI0031FE5D63